MSFSTHPRPRDPSRLLPAVALVVALVVVLAVALAVVVLPGCGRSPDATPAAEKQPAADAKPVATGPVVRLAASVEPAAAAPGGTVTVLWRLQPATGWHLYGNVRNDSGFAPRVKLALPPGWTAGPLQWPTPARHVAAGDILDHIYEGELVLLQDVTIPLDAAPGRVPGLRARWEWLACRDACVPGRDSLEVAIPVVADAAAVPASSSLSSSALATARARLPQPLPAGLVRATWEGDSLRLDRLGAAPGHLTFMPAEDCGDLVDLLHDGVGESLSLRLRADGGRLGPVRGLLLVEDAGSPARAFTIDVPAIDWTGDAAGATPTGG